jgi:peptide/nickel transport system permease protein
VEYQESVAEVLKRGIMPSLSLTVPILLGSVFVALSLSLVAAKYRGRSVDKAILLCSTVVMSVNYVIWVLAGQFFLSYKAGLFPVWGYESATFLLLPVLIGVISSLGTDVRFFRSAVLDEIYRPYVLSLRAKGLSNWSIMTRHVLRNSLIPIVTYISLSIPYLFTGSLLLEGFFGIPGLGSVSINAIHSSDMAVVRAVVIIGALLYQFINLTTDVLYAWLDPRVRLDL